MEAFSSVTEGNCEKSWFLVTYEPYTSEYKIKGICCDNFFGLKL
jgi:hypothetical protein